MRVYGIGYFLISLELFGTNGVSPFSIFTAPLSGKAEEDKGVNWRQDDADQERLQVSLQLEQLWIWGRPY